MREHPKSIDGLMRYLRDKKGMQIAGSAQKRKLRNIGYYHGYKGYRYIGTPSNHISFSDFDQLSAIYNFDSKIKALFYPWVMFIETAVKNTVLEVLIDTTKSGGFTDIYGSLLDNYKSFSPIGKHFKTHLDYERAEDRFKKELKKRLDLRDRVYRVQTEAYGSGNKIAVHYLQKDLAMPIWAIFELLSLGQFGYFVSCLNKPCRANISRSLGIRPADDNSALMTQRLIYAIKDLRNAIAHNDVIFDSRFRSGHIDKQVSNGISNATGVLGISFDTITDYLVLVVYMLKLFKVSKTELKRLVSDFNEQKEILRAQIPPSVFGQIIHTDSNTKIAQIKHFI